MTVHTITIRPPFTSSSSPQPSTYTQPPIPWLMEEWHVTHSTLPMWKSKRNVRIQYTALPASSTSIKSPAETDRIDDLVTYQSLKSTKIQTVRGIDKAAEGERRDIWNWRGKGWLVIAGSRWEVLGWGEEDIEEEVGESQSGDQDVQTRSEHKGQKNKWVITMFAKTLFTPQGVDIYSSRPEGLKAETLEGIKKGLAACPEEGVQRLAGELFEITIDGARSD